MGRVDRNLVEIGSSQSGHLSVNIGEKAALQERIIREINAGHNVRGTERDLLRFGEEVAGPASSTMRPITFNGASSSGMSFGRVQMIKWKLIRLLLREKLNRKLPLGKWPVAMDSNMSRRW